MASSLWRLRANARVRELSLWSRFCATYSRHEPVTLLLSPKNGEHTPRDRDSGQRGGARKLQSSRKRTPPSKGPLGCAIIGWVSARAFATRTHAAPPNATNTTCYSPSRGARARQLTAAGRRAFTPSTHRDRPAIAWGAFLMSPRQRSSSGRRACASRIWPSAQPTCPCRSPYAPGLGAPG